MPSKYFHYRYDGPKYNVYRAPQRDTLKRILKYNSDLRFRTAEDAAAALVMRMEKYYRSYTNGRLIPEDMAGLYDIVLEIILQEREQERIEREARKQRHLTDY